MSEPRPPSQASEEDTEPRVSQRTREGLDFERAVSFSDSVFAFAMTLLVVTIGIPNGVTKSQLAHALGEQLPAIGSFLISFAVIGYFWVGHHRFVLSLRYFTRPLLALNLAFLAAIAFVPFPTNVLGDYGTEIAVVLYAGTIATVSLLDTAMLVCARRTGAFRVRHSRQAFRYGLAKALIPVVVFGLSIPISLLSVTAAQLSWLLIIPAEHFAMRRKRDSHQAAGQ